MNGNTQIVEEKGDTVTKRRNQMENMVHAKNFKHIPSDKSSGSWSILILKATKNQLS